MIDIIATDAIQPLRKSLNALNAANHFCTEKLGVRTEVKNCASIHSSGIMVNRK
jgi:hypothetical protein